MVRFLVAACLALAGPATAAGTASATLQEVELAINSGRLDQARLMIAEMSEDGAPANGLARARADLAFAAGKDAEALERYRLLLVETPDETMLCERAGIAALRLNRLADARSYLACATAGPAAPQNASWRAWNARGVLADLELDWAEAARSYATALDLDKANPRILNNIGYSHLLQGEWAEAIAYFERAFAAEPSIARIANNLELARAAVDENLPRRLPRESGAAWAARLNDAGVAAEILGDRRRAIANFARALEASGTWYARAANNLEAVSSR